MSLVQVNALLYLVPRIILSPKTRKEPRLVHQIAPKWDCIRKDHYRSGQ
jgi:hypothetical protein